MLNYLKLLITVGSIFSILLFVGFFNLLSTSHEPTQEVVIISIDQELSRFKAPFDTERVSYQTRLDELNNSLLEQQMLYQAQMDILDSEILDAQDKLKAFQLTEQNLQSEVTRLRTTQVERLDVYRTQLQQAYNSHNERLAQLQSQLRRVQLELAEVHDRILRQ